MKIKKKLTIKTKITLWYTILLVLILTMVMVFLILTSGQISLTRLNRLVIEKTLQAAKHVRIENGGAVVHDDFVPLDEGVFLAVVDGNTIIGGNLPHLNLKGKRQGFGTGQGSGAGQGLGTGQGAGLGPVNETGGKVYTIKKGQEEYLAYDVCVTDSVFVRGMSPTSGISQYTRQLFLMVLLLFPLFTLVAALGGYQITKKAFKPVSLIAETAQSIGNSSNLSERIGMVELQDEIGQLAQTFDAMLEKLEKAFADEKQFTQDVSHELRTPLAVLKTQCEFALSQQPNNPEIKASLEVILSQTENMIRLVTQLLELARSDRNAKKLQFEKVDLKELIELVVEQMQDSAHEKHILLAAQLPQSDCFFNCDQTLMLRLLINLVQNALKFTPDDGMVSVILDQSEGDLLVSVTDTGIGIAAEDQEHIFKRFYQVNSSRTKSGGGGFGLGLSFCQWIASVHGGTIEVESTLGKGSTFRVLL